MTADIDTFLSRRGRDIAFPHHGISGQTAQAHGKRYNATIGIAFEDDRSPMRLSAMDSQTSLAPEEVYPYAPGFGVKALREQWAAFLRGKNPSLQSRSTLPVVTCGLTHGLSIAGYLFADHGSRIILPDQYWGNYRLIFERAYGAALTPFNTFDSEGFDVGSFEEKLKGCSDGKKIVLLNFPNNPTGYTVTAEEAQELVRILYDAAQKHFLVVLLDDAYFGLVYEDLILRESLFGQLADLHERLLVVKIDGATKEDYVWGHRVGFLTCARKGMTGEEANLLEDKAGGVVRATVSNAPHISQSMLLHLYASAGYAQEKEKKFDVLKRRYRKVKDILRKKTYTSCFTPLPFNSGYFMCLRLHKGLDAEAVRKVLLEKFDTGVIAIGTQFLRVAFSSVPEADIEQVFENIYQACLYFSQPSHVKKDVVKA